MNGYRCEKLASLYLKLHGYKIIDRNFHSRFGEIDVIAQKSDLIVFVEVKARGENAFYDPAYAVDTFKQKKIIKTAYYYIQKKHFEKMDCRFDVVEIKRKGICIKINHIKDAFGE